MEGDLGAAVLSVVCGQSELHQRSYGENIYLTDAALAVNLQEAGEEATPRCAYATVLYGSSYFFFLGALVRMLLDKEGTLDSHAQSLSEFDGTAYARTMKSQKTSGSSGFLTNMCSAHGEGVCVPSCFRFSATAIRLSRQISIFFGAPQLGCCNRKFIPRRVLTGKVRGATRLD